MQQQITLQLRPEEAASDSIISTWIAQAAGVALDDVSGFYRLKESIDARGKQVYVRLTVNAFINEPFTNRPFSKLQLKDTGSATHSVVIVGAGPAGLFAALNLIEQGIKPIILERGKDVRSRRRDLAMLNKEGVVDVDSNYCFGEGGAGTYSDGKLYTRSNKRGSIDKILNMFVEFGAEEKILYQAHPHIGTNKLPHIITAMRAAITAHGGEFLFQQRVVDIITNNNVATGVITAAGDRFEADAVILATGHSARDVFELLHRKNIVIEAKPFALGVRVEHPQALINEIQYGRSTRLGNSNDVNYLPPASYSVVEQVNNKGVFSFCMCPGGIIAPAATSPGELVVNGWSPSKRNNPYANSGMVVEVKQEDAYEWLSRKGIKQGSVKDPLLLMRFQQEVESNCFDAGGGRFVAPAQRLVDFCENKVSTTLPGCSYIPGVRSSELKNVLPSFIASRLAGALKAFGKKMRGYYTNEGILVATESRTSSPVRIPRDRETLEHIQIKQLYPCAEGAGYAGGIVSAAMDGERVALTLARKLKGQ